MPRVCVFEEDEMLIAGLDCLGITEERRARVNRKTCRKWFRQSYGSEVAVCLVIWRDLQTMDSNLRLVVQDPETDLKAFLVTLYFLRKYPTEVQQHLLFGWSERRLRRTIWDMLPRMEYLFTKKIKWPDAWKVPKTSPLFQQIPKYLVSADGIHFKIQEPHHGRWSKNPAYFSHKLKHAALTCIGPIETEKPRT